MPKAKLKRHPVYPSSKYQPTEAQEGTDLARWLDRKGILYCHVPNGGRRNPLEGASFKRQGVKPGVPDYLIFSPVPGIPHLCGVAIELKRQRGGRLSKEQRGWLEELAGVGWAVYTAKGAADAIAQLERLGY